MKREHNPPYGALIERGRIAQADAEAGTYTVESLDRPGVTTPPMKTIDEAILDEDALVFFFMFNDGGGKIIGKMG